MQRRSPVRLETRDIAMTVSPLSTQEARTVKWSLKNITPNNRVNKHGW